MFEVSPFFPHSNQNFYSFIYLFIAFSKNKLFPLPILLKYSTNKSCPHKKLVAPQEASIKKGKAGRQEGGMSPLFKKKGPFLCVWWWGLNPEHCECLGKPSTTELQSQPQLVDFFFFHSVIFF
jgi:hypothetical protein